MGFIDKNGFSIGDYGFVMAIMGFHWRLWVINGNYGLNSNTVVAHLSAGFQLSAGLN